MWWPHDRRIRLGTGLAANVFLYVADYQKLIDKINLMMDIYKGEQDIAAGRVHSMEDARRAMLLDEDSLAGFNL